VLNPGSIENFTDHYCIISVIS